MSTIVLGQAQPIQPSSFLKRILARLEKFRVQNHLRIVENELRRKDVSHLSPILQERRAQNLDRLHDYWSKGIFPKNTDFANSYMPYFKDDSGTPCAMAYLIEQSGARGLVSAVSTQNNHVFINDIQDGPVMAWINASGLTKAEAARVQPGYSPGCSSILDCSGYVAPVSNSLHVPYWILYALAFIILEIFASYVSSWIAAGNGKRRIVSFVFFTIINLAILGLIAITILRISGYY